MNSHNKKCGHISAILSEDLKEATVYACEECIKTGDKWVHLRTCQSCGITLCCDSSVNKHASSHAVSHKHPIVISSEPGERWMWCYEDNLFYQY